MAGFAGRMFIDCAKGILLEKFLLGVDDGSPFGIDDRGGGGGGGIPSSPLYPNPESVL